jgi:hypothetical protein
MPAPALGFLQSCSRISSVQADQQIGRAVDIDIGDYAASARPNVRRAPRLGRYVSNDASYTSRGGRNCVATSPRASRARAIPTDAMRGDTSDLPTKSRHRALHKRQRPVAAARTNYALQGRTSRRLPAGQIRGRAPGQLQRETLSCWSER